MAANGTPRKQFNCLECPAYCCSYPNIPVTIRDLRRLAKRFGLSLEDAERRFTKKGSDGTRVMRHRVDHLYPTTCQFLDQETRNCTVYEDRPGLCREFPSTHRCGYYDFLKWERENQQDDEFVPIVV